MSPESPSPGVAPRSDNAARNAKQRTLANILPRLVASLVIGAGFVWLLARGGMPLLPKAEELRRVPTWAIAGFVLMQLGAILLRNYRWVFLLRPIAPRVRTGRVLGIGFVGFSAIFLAPLRMGEIVRPYLIAQDGEVTFMQAAGTVFAERTIDGVLVTLFTVTAMSLARTVSPLPTSLGDLPLPLLAVKAAVYSATFLFVGLFLVMVAFYAAREPARRITHRLVGLVSPRAANWAASTLERVADGLRFLPSSSNLLSFLSVSLVYWAFMIGGQWLLIRGAGLPASAAQATTMVGILGLGSIVPAGPGLFGAYQISGFSALALFFPLDQVRAAGAAVIFVAYVVHLTLSSLQFVIGFLVMARVPAHPAQ